MTVATEDDFGKFFSLAKAHGLSFEDCLSIAKVECGKNLGQFSKEELEAFELRICKGVFGL